ncbi:MAG: hypothetical protein ABI204_13875 [Ginsengibacter sp.]
MKVQRWAKKNERLKVFICVNRKEFTLLLTQEWREKGKRRIVQTLAQGYAQCHLVKAFSHIIAACW